MAKFGYHDGSGNGKPPGSRVVPEDTGLGDEHAAALRYYPSFALR
jgi:hypothetical protein